MDYLQVRRARAHTHTGSLIFGIIESVAVVS